MARTRQTVFRGYCALSDLRVWRYSTRDLIWSLVRGPPADWLKPGMEEFGIPLDTFFLKSRLDSWAREWRDAAMNLWASAGGSWHMAQTASYNSFPLLPLAGMEWHSAQDPAKSTSPAFMAGCAGA